LSRHGHGDKVSLTLRCLPTKLTFVQPVSFGAGAI
jgi:hypothetical protein